MQHSTRADLIKKFVFFLSSKLIRVVLFSLLCVSSLSARMKEARGAGTSHISILWVFDKIFAVFGVIQGETLPRICS